MAELPVSLGIQTRTGHGIYLYARLGSTTWVRTIPWTSGRFGWG